MEFLYNLKAKKNSAEDLWGGNVEFGKVSGIMGLDTGTLYSRTSPEVRSSVVLAKIASERGPRFSLTH